MKELRLPNRITKHISGMHCEQNHIGFSQASVYRFSSNSKVYYLKIEPTLGELKSEYQNLQWMSGRLPVPQIIDWETDDERDYLLISEISGRMLCDDYYLQRPHSVVALLAEGINLLRSVDIKSCPLTNNLSRKLKNADLNIQNNKVDMGDWEAETNRFATPQDLLIYLRNNQPKEDELVLTHGDYCLPNIFADGNRITGFIDLGRAGIADLWQDVALCIRSLHYNFHTSDYDDLLLQQLGITRDQEKLDYYIMLDELF
jgi:aminoglycoside 3'-phosphotransferase III